MSSEVCADIIRIKEIVCGNGSKGLTEKVDEHEVFIQRLTGSFSTIKWLLGLIGVSNIALVVKAFIK